MNQRTAKMIHRLEGMLARGQRVPQLERRLKRAWYATPWDKRHKLRAIYTAGGVAAWRKALGLAEEKGN